MTFKKFLKSKDDFSDLIKEKIKEPIKNKKSTINNNTTSQSTSQSLKEYWSSISGNNHKQLNENIKKVIPK